jgi:hypothetical protein
MPRPLVRLCPDSGFVPLFQTGFLIPLPGGSYRDASRRHNESLKFSNEALGTCLPCAQ